MRAQGIDSPKRQVLKSRKLACLQNSIQLPSNLLQQKRNILQQFRSYHMATHEVKRETYRDQIQLMSKTFSNTKDNSLLKDDKYDFLMQQKGPKSKQFEKKLSQRKNPLYKRISSIQAENKQLVGVSFSKLLSRMLVIDEDEKFQTYKTFELRNKKYRHDNKRTTIPNYKCLQSKMFTIEQPEEKVNSHQNSSKKSKKQSISAKKFGEPITDRLLRRYFNAQGEENQKGYDTIDFDERYIYRNGKKSECRRIHNFYTSTAFKRSYDKHIGIPGDQIKLH